MTQTITPALPPKRRFSRLKKALVCLIGLCGLGSMSRPAQAQNPAGYEWQHVAIGGGGFVSAIIPSKTEAGLVYARTDVGGAYRWEAASSRWIPLLDWTSAEQTGYQGVESLALDPQAPGKVYLLAGTSYFNGGKTVILRSDDYGHTFALTEVSTQFKAHGNGMGRQTGEKLVVDPNNGQVLYCGTRWNGLFKSANAGQSWNRLGGLNVTTTPNENGVSFVLLDPASKDASGTQTLYAGISATGNNLFRSTDGGQSFTAVAGAPTNLMPQRAVLASDGHLFITYANGAGPSGHWAVPEPMDAGQIWKYKPQTGAWTKVTPAGYSRAFSGISVDPQDPQRLVASTINTYLLQDKNAYGDRVFLSTNGGTSWTDVFAGGVNLDANGNSWINGHAIHWAGSIEFDPADTRKVWVTSGNGVFKTEDIQARPSSWKFTVKGLEETVPLDLVSLPNGPLVSVIGDYDGFRHTNVSQYAPIHTPQMGTTTGLAFGAQNTNVLLRVGEKMFYSTNMGQSWVECPKNGKKGQVAVSANGSTFLHCPEGSATTYRSTNQGVAWTVVAGLPVSDARPVADEVNTNKFYAYNSSNGRLLVSTDGGASFTAAGSPGSGGSKVIRVTPGVEGHVWVALYGGGLSRSTNSGASFSRVSSVSACGAVGLGKPAPGSTYPSLYIWGTVNNVTGLHRSTDQGTTWVRINDDAHQYGGPGNGQFVVGDRNVYGRVYMSTVGRGIVYGQPEGTLVTGIRAYEAFSAFGPNPFSGSLQLQVPGAFGYTVTNVVGATVAAGKGRDRALVGGDLAPGVYLLSVTSSNKVQTVKIIKQ